MRKYFLLNVAFVVFFLGISVLCNAQLQNQKKIQIMDFRVEKNQNKVEINWSTGDKAAANYFEIEKSNDGKTFKTIAYVLGADPTKTDCDCYDFSDKINSGSGETYYRLKHINTNGQVQFSDIKALALK